MATSTGSPGGWGEAYAVAPVAPPPAKLRPGRVWYWVALAVLVAGVAWWVVSFVMVTGRVNSFQRVPFPGTGVISLMRGDYVVYYEGRGASSGTVPEGHVHMVSLSKPAAGGDITMTPYSGSLTYQFGLHLGTAAGTVQIPVSGRYRVLSISPAPRGGHLAIGSSIAGWIVGAVVPTAVVPATVLMLAGIVGAVVVAIIRYRRLKRARLLQPLELAVRSLFPLTVASVRAGSGPAARLRPHRRRDPAHPYVDTSNHPPEAKPPVNGITDATKPWLWIRG